MKILNPLKQICKSYTEGIYADTPANRKLGRVGMSYSSWESKQKEKEQKKKDTIKKFTLEEVKQKVQAEIDKYKKKNDYITISTDNGYTFRFSRDLSMTGNNSFNECLVKDKEGKVLKTFKNSSETDLMNSTYRYIQDLDVDIVSESKSDEDIDIEANTSVIKAKMQEAKDKQTGTIIAKGSGDKTIYLMRDKVGRWLKDFNAYSIRDSKRNILSQGKTKSEEEFIEKLNKDLEKYNIQLEK